MYELDGAYEFEMTGDGTITRVMLVGDVSNLLTFQSDYNNIVNTFIQNEEPATMENFKEYLEPHIKDAVRNDLDYHRHVLHNDDLFVDRHVKIEIACNLDSTLIHQYAAFIKEFENYIDQDIHYYNDYVSVRTFIHAHLKRGNILLMENTANTRDLLVFNEDLLRGDTESLVKFGMTYNVALDGTAEYGDLVELLFGDGLKVSQYIDNLVEKQPDNAAVVDLIKSMHEDNSTPVFYLAEEKKLFTIV